MPQADGIVSNASGAAVRADINNQLAALFTNHSGATEPATTYAYQFWADTTAGQLKLRNSSNTDWIVLIELDGTTLMEDGTVSAPGLAFADDLNTGFYRPAADSLGIATNGTNAIYIDSSQNVGIGVTSPGSLLHTAANDPEVRIQDLSSASANTADARLGFYHSGGTKIGEIGFTAAGGPTSLKFQSNVATGLTLGTNSTDVLHINSSGNVGIGTTSPAAALHVSASTAEIRLTDSDGAGAYSQFISGATGNLFIGADPGNTGANSYTAFLIDNSEKARLDSSGRLLVGTSTARSVAGATSSSFEIETGSAFAFSAVNNVNSASGPVIALGKTRGTSAGAVTSVSSGDALGYIRFAGADGTDLESLGAEIRCEVDGTPGSNDMPGRLSFRTTADGAASPTERMRIDSSGNIKSGSSCDFLPSIDAGFAGHADLGDPTLRFEDAYVRDGVTSGSDRNYKSDIRELSDAERAVAVSCKSLLRAWKWTEAVDLKGDAARIHIGIVAQDLEQAFAAQGLDAHSYAMFCEDTWYEVDGNKEDDNGNEYTADSNGAVAVTRLSVRYHELLAFIIAAI